MKLYILGKTKKDKGDQLEGLTSHILQSQGYHVTKKEISNGGFDIDVRANRGIEKIICECKAHKKKISTTDFLKFIGKVYIDNLQDKNTRGIIVALSGVNPNVEGNFNTLKKLSSDNLVELIHNEHLVEWINKSYGAVDEIIARKRILAITDKHIKHLSLAYYETNVYWISLFSDMTFTILEHSAEDNPSKKVIEYCKK